MKIRKNKKSFVKNNYSISPNPFIIMISFLYIILYISILFETLSILKAF
jgi:hypothetical protein